MKPETVSLLCNPRTREALRLETEPAPGGGTRDTLVGVDSGERFAIRAGIPMLLEEQQVAGLNRRYRRFYNFVAPVYDGSLRLLSRLVGGTLDEFRLSYIHELEVRDGNRVLEVSVGTGANLQYLPAGASCYGLDISWGMLRRCRRNLKTWRRETELFLGNAEALPFRDEQFDVVFHVGGINAFSDRGKAIREMIRVAKSGTRIVIVDETAKMVSRLKWLPGTARVLAKYGERFIAPVDLVPPGMQEVNVGEIIHGDFYCLTFRKP